MINYLTMVVLPNIGELCQVVALCCVPSIIVLTIAYFCLSSNWPDENELKLIKNIIFCLKITAYAGIVTAFTSCFMPSQKQVLQLQAMSLISKIEGIENLPQNIADKLNELFSVDK